MKTPVSAALALSAALASSSLMAASLKIPLAFEFLGLNGQVIKRSIVKHQDELEFAPGQHEIALRYSDMVESDLVDTMESVKSAAFIITLDASDDGDYVLAPAVDGPIRDPMAFARAPEVIISRADGSAAEFTFTQTDVTRDFAVGLYGTAVTASAVPATPAPSASVDVVETVSGNPAAPAPLPIDTSGASAEDMLQLWWQRADSETRKKFLSWAIEQL